MNKVRLALVGALVVGLAVAARGQEDKGGKGDLKKTLVGTWEVTKGKGAPPGATIEFTTDGKVVMQFEKDGKKERHEASYKVAGKGFTMTMKRGDMEVMQKIEVAKVMGDEMVLKG